MILSLKWLDKVNLIYGKQRKYKEKAKSLTEGTDERLNRNRRTN